MLILIMFTPLGALVYDKQDERLRESVIEISKRVSSLQDSLRARDRQLHKIQQVLSEGEDTTFQITENALSLTSYPDQGQQQNWSPEISSDVNAYESFSRREIIFSGILKKSPSFPAPYPVHGTLTRGFNQESGHLGIDIAAKNQATFQAVADGTVINYDWTMNYGM
ncbi:MAG: hypothetical protein U5K69_25390 [Balneolaceae bacterium]|nr:hypothetical protein [Balneolaceae bacterium]